MLFGISQRSTEFAVYRDETGERIEFGPVRLFWC